MFEVIVLAVVALYALQTMVYIIASYKKFMKLPDDQLPTVSVIVAARNEEREILRCLRALDKLEYPYGKLEIIIVDDRSTDSTGQIIDQFIADKKRFVKIHGVEPVDHLRGKTNALVQGLKRATGEVILTTDADCEVNPLWAKTMASYFTGGVGLCGGMTCQKRGSIWNGMQHLDFIYLLGAGSGTINVGIPLSVIGNNMAYLRKAYDETGGYENLPFSVTEDSQLLAEISALGKYKIIYPVDKDSLIESEPEGDLPSLFRQKKRWSLGGTKVPFHGILVLASSVAAHALPLVLLFFSTALALRLISGLALVDLIFLVSLLSRLKMLSTIKYFPFFEVYYFIYVTIMPVVLMFSQKVEWKGRKF